VHSSKERQSGPLAQHSQRQQSCEGSSNSKWRLAAAFPKTLDTLFGATEIVAKRVSEAPGGKFEIRVFAAGEIVPAFGVLDAVQQGTVECAHSSSTFFFGKDEWSTTSRALRNG
jgi:TRAP-type mannitol/chloroaromatic compound transport system substrate-binding protein